MDTKQMIGARIAEVRNRKGMTQEQLAGIMGISSKYLSSIERGKENPTLDTLINLSESLTTDLGELLSTVQIEDPMQRKTLVNALINEVDPDQLKIIFNIIKAVVR